jgi:hypothetical protein
MTDDRTITAMAGAIVRMLERQHFLGELQEHRRFARRVRRQEKPAETQTVKDGEAA